MADTFQDICWGVIRGFQDAVLGSMKIFKLDSEQVEGKEQQQKLTTLARRRAEKQKQTNKTEKKESEPKVTHRIFQCCAWNGGVFWMSILLFNYVLLPGLHQMTSLISGSTETGLIWSWMGPMLTWTFSALWILPLFVLSKIVNCFWFADIADAAYRKVRGRPQLPNISIFIADMMFSLVIQIFFLLQGTAASFLPLPAVGQVISVLHMSLLYSLYSFEYKWINMGWELHKRLSHIELSWPYFFGFGLPMAVLTALPSSLVVSGCVFSILFPVFIISANEAQDAQQQFMIPLRLFAPVVSLTNTLFHITTKGSESTSTPANRPMTTRQSRTQENVTFR
ncbi:etoposide-induced protein 2.4 homolog [Ruditapes philippinarum]|uniref:etoposide-induced protein 2.4 homolog n=1 Tax=Ruditapes philippinarum TaxID=129788 RepID=UPI00295BBDD6|nr:etoposide-induced protein 2.4 homolog [Ruditapes philippinarum]XP_060607251.1 etoposide-induced protein 2.4 homolog [Ruditapes philippinarum]XP_060607252.1 etoposide-induced protein 2.4 homolog [Ruditapes philippinarum]XP_060607253.1 etoposide-induced protein 2.4 homolog [Ruditapes philippinarum]